MARLNFEHQPPLFLQNPIPPQNSQTVFHTFSTSSTSFSHHVTQAQSLRTPHFRCKETKSQRLHNLILPTPKTVSSSTKVTGTTTTSNPETPSAASAPAVKWDKEAWVKKLTDEQRGLLKLEIETLHESWLKELKDEVVSKEFLDLKRFLKREIDSGKKVVSPMEDVSRHTPLNTVKAVILGQDPYHNYNQAHGLAFSVRLPTPAPPSLVNTYECLKNDYPSFSHPPNKGGLLTPWADRGVLLLNTCLTVRAHEANSHANRGWVKFTQKVIDIVDKKRLGGVVFLA